MPRRRQPEPPIYTFRVRVRGGYYAPPGATEVWREIEVAANQTLADLGNAIPLAFDFDDPHLWSFFLSGKAWDRATEYALHSEPGLAGGPRPGAAGRVQLRDVPFPGATGRRSSCSSSITGTSGTSGSSSGASASRWSPARSTRAS